jgi:hypothetical protein
MTPPTPSRLKEAVTGLPGPARNTAYRVWGAAHGQWPTPVADVVQPWLTRNPVTFNDMVRHRIATDHSPLIALFADKLRARDYAAERIDASLLLPVLASGRRAADLPWADLPREYVCKVNHGSGGVIVVSDCAPVDAVLPAEASDVGWRRYLVRPEQAPHDRIGALVDRWLHLPYRRHPGAYPEWAYREIDRQVLVEPYWPGTSGLPPMTNVLCFDGRIGAYFCSIPDTEVKSTRVSWHLADEGADAAARIGLGAREWAAVEDASRALSKGADMVRVDWLIGSGGPRFCELTNYPGAGHNDYTGHARLTAREYEARLVTLWLEARARMQVAQT